MMPHLWRRFKIQQTRRFVQQKLWRMVQKGMLQSVEGRKGVYALPVSVSANAEKAQTVVKSKSWADDLDEEIPF